MPTTMTDIARSISSLRRRRGVARALITRLTKTVGELEGKTGDPKTLRLVQRNIKRLKTLDREFQEHHGNLVVFLETEEELAKEQEILDTHDEEVSLTMYTLNKSWLLALSLLTPTHKTISRWVACLKKGLEQLTKIIDELSGDTDYVCLLHYHEEQLSDIKKDL